MVFFLGILDPGKRGGKAASEAPAKAPFFGGVPDAAIGAVPMSRLEQEVSFLNGKAPEPTDRAEPFTGEASQAP